MAGVRGWSPRSRAALASISLGEFNVRDVDLDMIPFGQLQLMSPPSKDASKSLMDKGDIALAGRGVHRSCQLTEAQKQTFITLRALADSPLMVGGDLPTMDEHSLSLVTNPDMLACNQNGVMGSLIQERNGLEIWKTGKKNVAGEGWIGVFNRSDNPNVASISLQNLGLDPTKQYNTFDVWGGKPFTFGKFDLPPQGCLFIHYIESE